MSLSPSLISSLMTGSFSLIIGTAPLKNRVFIVLVIFCSESSRWVVYLVIRICPTAIPWREKYLS